VSPSLICQPLKERHSRAEAAASKLSPGNKASSSNSTPSNKSVWCGVVWCVVLRVGSYKDVQTDKVERTKRL